VTFTLVTLENTGQKSDFFMTFGQEMTWAYSTMLLSQHGMCSWLKSTQFMTNWSNSHVGRPTRDLQ